MEKRLFRRFLKSALVMLAVVLALHLAADIIRGNDYSDTLDCPTVDGCPSDSVTLSLEEDDALEILEYKPLGSRVYVKLHGLRAGTTFLKIRNGVTGECDTYCFTVSGNGRIINENTGNFSAFQTHFVLTALSAAAFSVLLWIFFRRAQKTLRYSYQAIFYCGFGIWTGTVTVLLTIQLIRRLCAFDLYRVLHTSGVQFLLFTSPLLLLFCVALCVSNISLVRHEGFRSRNLLGILLSAVILLGVGSALAVNYMPVSGSDTFVTFFTAAGAAYAAIFLLLECFLLGAIICGQAAARHIPAYDRDYIIILGCKFRRDGTLYPLVRGRVDRALAFYREQICRGGSHPVLIPSGGQGSDEIMPEARAMRSYMLEQGIPDADILPEEKSRNTVENIRFSYELIRGRTADPKVAFSTTNYHVFRSGIIARQNGFAPEGIGSRTKWYFWPNAYIRECIGMVVYMRRTLLVMLCGMIAAFALLVYLL